MPRGNQGQQLKVVGSLRGTGTPAGVARERCGLHLQATGSASDAGAEKSPYQIHIPVPNTKGGIRKSLKTPDRETAISKAEEMVLEVKVQLRQGGSVVALPVEDLVETFPQIQENEDPW